MQAEAVLGVVEAHTPDELTAALDRLAGGAGRSLAGGRSDLSFTIALSGPDDYEGGALVLESPGKEEVFRLPVGHALVYPSTMLHRVEPVTSGERFVAVGWIESRIRHADQRELLFELDMAGRTLFERSGGDEVFDSISRTYANLLRRWEC